MLIFPEFDPVALQLGPLVVRWYGLAYVASLLLGLWYVKKIATWHKAKNITTDTLESFFIWTVVGVVAGGRIGYVLFYGWDKFMADPLWALRLWEGGMSFHGGAAGVIAAMLLFGKLKKLHPADLADRVVPAVPIGLFLGRIANFINGELWGKPVSTDLPWAMVFPHVDDLPRHPSQLYEAGLEGLVLGAALYLTLRGKKIRRWLPSAVFLIGYGVARFVVEYFREPEIVHHVAGLTISQGQVLCLPLIAFGLVCLYLAYGKK